MNGFCYIWEYRVRPEFIGDFEAAYGAGGDWERLFRRDPAYLGTHLGRDDGEAGRYITIDYWSSGAACRAFRERWREEFEAVDRRCEAFTLAERHVGDFRLEGGVRLPAGEPRGL